MPQKTRWIVRGVVWGLTGLGAVIIATNRGELSPRSVAQYALWLSLAFGLFGFLYFAGGAVGDAFPRHTVVDLNAAQNRRGQPLDHGRGALRRPTFGGVVMMAASLAAFVSLGLWFLMGS